MASLVVFGCSASADDADDCLTLGGSRRLCGSRSVVVPVVSSDGSARVRARVDGQDVELLLDTGAEMTVLSPSLVGAENEIVTRAHELCIGDLCLENEPVYAWETTFSAANGPGPNGFVGMRTLRDFSLEFDHASTAGLHFDEKTCSGSSLTLTFSEYGIPSVEVTVHTLPASSVTIDTGATYTLLSQTTSGALAPGTLEPKTPAPLCTVDGCQDGVAFTAILPQYCVGNACESDLSVKFPAFDAVGMTFFARRHTMFDFARSALWLCDP